MEQWNCFKICVLFKCINRSLVSFTQRNREHVAWLSRQKRKRKRKKWLLRGTKCEVVPLNYAQRLIKLLKRNVFLSFRTSCVSIAKNNLSAGVNEKTTERVCYRYKVKTKRLRCLSLAFLHFLDMSFGQIDSTRLLNDFSFVEHSLIFRTAVDLQSPLLTLVQEVHGSRP